MVSAKHVQRGLGREQASHRHVRAHNKFGYKDFIPQFKAENFDPAAWARLFKESGAKYVVPVFEHHDGFAMYDCGLSDWTAVKMGPHRDPMGRSGQSRSRRRTAPGGVLPSRRAQFLSGTGPQDSSDVNDPKYAAFYGPAHHWLEANQHTPLANDFTYVSKAWTDDWLARSSEIVEKYHPDIMYFDWWIGQPSCARPDSLCSVLLQQIPQTGRRGGVINYKDYAMQEQSAVLDIERGQLSGIRPQYWQTDTSISNKSWGYIENDTFKSPEFVVHQLIDIVSKNGNLLMNIGPRSDGTIPDEVQQVLRDSWRMAQGEWRCDLRNARLEGLRRRPDQGCRGFVPRHQRGDYTAQDFRFTKKGDTLYAIEMAWPANGEAVIHTFGSSGVRRWREGPVGRPARLRCQARV